MAITNEQVKDVEQLRTSVHGLVSKGVTDEYLLATYNGIIRRLDDRLPKIRQRAEGKSLKEESRKLVRQQREALSRKSGAGSTTARPSSQKAS
jgi:hypothetical protein